MENRSEVFPGAWMAWNYRHTLGPGVEGPALRHPPPVLGQLERLGVAVPQ
jgi:hypothetical protein